jgi:DNA primase
MESNWVDFKTIKQAVTIGQVLDHYGVKLKKSGKELRGRCPIHQGDGTDSFHVSTDKNAFHCFSCQAKGNILDFVAAMEKCSVRDAGLKLQKWFSVTAVGQAAEPETKVVAGGQLATEKVGDRGEPNKPLGFRLQVSTTITRTCRAAVLIRRPPNTSASGSFPAKAPCPGVS